MQIKKFYSDRSAVRGAFSDESRHKNDAMSCFQTNLNSVYIIRWSHACLSAARRTHVTSMLSTSSYWPSPFLLLSVVILALQNAVLQQDNVRSYVAGIVRTFLVTGSTAGCGLHVLPQSKKW